MASTDQGTSVQIDQQTKRSPANGLQGTTSASYGSYDLMQGTIHNQMDDLSFTTVNISRGLLPHVGGGSSVILYFKMVGYYVTGTVYESFVTTGTPATSTTTNPNTGHTLVNTYVSSFYSR